MAQPRVLAIVLAGGEGKRLMPLTVDRAKDLWSDMRDKMKEERADAAEDAAPAK